MQLLLPMQRYQVKQLRITVVLKTNEGGRWIIPHLLEMIRRGHSVTVIIPRGPGKLKTILHDLDVKVEDASFDFKYRPSLKTLIGLLRLRRQLVRSQADVLHYHLYASALAVRIASLGLRIPRVHMVAGPLYLDSPVISAVERKLMGLDTLVVAGSAHTAARYRALGRAANGLTALPYGVDTDKFRPPLPEEQASARHGLGLGADVFVAVMIAYVYGPKNLVYPGVGIKGHDVLLAAWKEFIATHPNSQLLLVGAGFDVAGRLHRDELMSRYSDPALNITWIDSVDDVRPYYWASNVSVSPSLSENHGAALEAGACGVARIVSEAGGLPETTDSTSGWVVPVNDVSRLSWALSEAYADFESASLAAKGRASRAQILAGFNDKETAAALVDSIERLASGRIPARGTSGAAIHRHRSSLLPEDSPGKPHMGYTRVKRVVDVVVAGLLLVMTLPIQASLYVAVRKALGRPVLFRQQRPGLAGVPFELLKFRTMKNPDAAKGLVSDEDRMTPFGRWLRSTSLDELPSLVNVLRGEMSLVGPRPLLMKYLERYTPEQARRHEVKPGITGLAQVSGRNLLEWEEKLQLDTFYARNISLGLDLAILLRTFPALFRSSEVAEVGYATKREFPGENLAKES
ncbi:hypothetical protein C3B78_15555 [Arthrobacter sp. PGP41]|nr:hypothetical protein C3B78_15555 [Arthrobacter sp. PGP41]